MHVLRRFRWIPIVVSLFIVGVFLGWGLLFSIYLPDTRSGLVELQNGQDSLFIEPDKSAAHFAKARQHFQTSSQRLQDTPVFLKTLTALPPFRWYVRLLKASDEMALAGSQATTLRKSFPVFDFDQQPNLPTLASTTSSRYCTWFQDAKIADFIVSLEQAEAHLEAIPAWIIVGQRSSVEQLRGQINLLAQRSQWTQKSSEYLCSTKASTLLIIRQGDRPSHTVLLQRERGQIKTLAFTPASEITFLRPRIENLIEEGSGIRSEYRLSTGKEIDELALIDATTLKQLELVSGQLGTELSTPEPYLQELVQKLSLAPEVLVKIQPVLESGVREKSLQFWSSNTDAQKLFE